MTTTPAEKPAAIEKRRTPVAVGERGLALDNLDAMIRFAQGLIDGGMVPKGVRSPGAVVGLIEAGKELGLAPMYALSNLTFTNGRLGIMGDAAKALIRKAGALEPGTDFEEIYSGEEYTADWKCTVTAHRKGQPKPFESSFSITNALTAKLVQLKDRKILTHSREGGWGEHGAPWSAYTKRMLMYRALGFLVRDRFSDILGGAVLTEELRDYPHDSKVEIVQPLEPDPLLADAVAAETATANTDMEEIRDGDTLGRNTISDDEAALLKALDKLEGAILSSTSLSELELAYSEATPLLAKVAASERARLEKLLNQNKTGFTAPVK